MTKTPRGKAFDENEPELTEDEIELAKNGGTIAVSFKGKPVLLNVEEIGFLAVKFALANGGFQTLLLDQFSAKALHGLIETANVIEWKTDVVRPKGRTH
jgi:hypothetical protein